jgi:hypothetical protein
LASEPQPQQFPRRNKLIGYGPFFPGLGSRSDVQRAKRVGRRTFKFAQGRLGRYAEGRQKRQTEKAEEKSLLRKSFLEGRKRGYYYAGYRSVRGGGRRGASFMSRGRLEGALFGGGRRSYGEDRGRRWEQRRLEAARVLLDEARFRRGARSRLTA